MARRATTAERKIRSPLSIDRLIESQPWDGLVPILEHAGAEPSSVIPKLKAFVRLLLEWNRGASNLISRHDERRIVERHVRESLLPAAWLKESGARVWLDLGSGGGFPAIPLAMAGVGESWTLVESRRSKTLFLRKLLQDLAIGHVGVEQARLEDMIGNPLFIGKFDGFTSRATMRLQPTLELAAPLVRVGGRAFLWKGSGHAAELVEAGSWRDHWRPEWARTLDGGPASVLNLVRL